MKFFLINLQRAIFNNKKFTLLFVLNLSLGLVGFFSVETFKSSMSQTIQDRAKLFLSADASAQVRRLMKPEEVEKITSVAGSGVQVSRVQEFFSMVTAQEQTRLVNVKAVDASYPYYGSITLDDGRRIENQGSVGIQSQPLIWVYPEVLTYFKLNRGDSLKLGKIEFIIDGVVVDDSTQTFRLSTLAPRVYIGLNQVAATELISFGTTMSDILLFKTSSDASTLELVANLKKSVTDSAFRFETYTEAGEDNGRALQFLTDYLGLVSMVSLFLSALGTLFLFRSFLTSQLKTIAIWNSLGLSKKKIQILLSLLVLSLGFLAALLSSVLSLAILPLMASALGALTPLKVELSFSFATMIELFFIGTLGGWLFVLPFLSSISRIKPQELFQDEAFQKEKILFKDFLLFLPFLVCFSWLAVVQSKSFPVGLGFVVGLLVASFVLLAIGYIVLSSLSLTRLKTWWAQQALFYMVRKKGLSLAAIGAIGLGALLINLIPQLRSSLKGEFEAPDSKVLPSLFMFDIQQEQVEPLKALLQNRKIDIGPFSPLIRARILKINDTPFERLENSEEFETREAEAERRFRNRGVNLSVRSKPSQAEKVIAGTYFSGSYVETAKLPEISIEEDYAKRIKAQLNDIMTFDVQGVEIKGQITSIRQVKWNSFQPNFFVVFQPGVLDEAPQMFLNSLPKMSESELSVVQKEIVEQFPNISIIDVGRSVSKFIEVAESMSWSLEAMAFVSILTGLFILFSMASRHALQRRWDLNMLKILGASSNQVVKSYLLEFFAVGVLSSIVGIFLSIGFTFALSVFVFNGRFTMQWQTPLLSLLLITLLCALIPFLASRRTLNAKPILFLNSRD